FKMWLLCAALAVLCFVVSADGDSKAVTTTLTTKWPSTPLLLELIVKRAGQLLSPTHLKLLRFALSLRSYSATVHAFQQIASNEPPPPDCRVFFNVHGEKSCNPQSLKDLLDTASERPKPFLFKGDHRFPSANPDAPIVILYAELGTGEFSRFHQQMLSKANKGLINYVLRHYLPSRVFLSGYGVELAIKNQEYKAKDDTQVQVAAFLREQLKELRKHLVESTNEMAPLKVWQMQDLSFQTAARILAAPSVDALNVMRDLSQNFPNKPGFIFLPAFRCVWKINCWCVCVGSGRRSILDILRSEARVMEGLRSLLVDSPHVHDILKLDVQPADSDYGVDIRSPAVYWINNLETDGRYASWPSNVQELLRPTFPGVIRQIRKNFHNLVMILDPTHENTAELLSVAEMFYTNNIPLRIGLVFVVNDGDDVDGMQDAGVAVLRAFNYIADEVDNQMAFDALVSVRCLRFRVFRVCRVRNPDVLGADSAYDTNRKEGRAYYEQTGVGPLPVVLYNGMPLQREQLDPDELETTVMHKILETTSFFQRAVYLLGSDHDVVDFIMKQPNVVPRINSRILATNRSYLDLSSISQSRTTPTTPHSPRARLFALRFSPPPPPPRPAPRVPQDGAIRPVTFWVVGDFDQPSGRQLLYDGIRHMKTSNNVRLGVINNPTESPSNGTALIGLAIWAAMQTQTANNAKNFITKLTKEETARALYTGADPADFAVGGMDVSLFMSVYQSSKVNFLLAHADYCRDVLKLRKGQRAVISNGRLPFCVVRQLCFHVRHAECFKGVCVSVCVCLCVCVCACFRASDLVMKVDSLLSSQPKGESRVEYNFASDRYSAVKIRPREQEVYFDVVAVADPVTRGAQRLAPLLLVLKQLVNVNLRVFMNCQSKLSDMPLKSFYRYVLEPDVSFLADNSFAPGPMAKFLDMPQSPLFTLNLSPPESWMVESVRTRHDLDNIYLQESVVAAEYELEYLLLEGHCFDVSTGQPPRGLQFTLGTAAEPVIVDTIVMANLGYFQLKANPGAWVLRLRKGRSDDIYKIYSHDGTDSPAEAEDLIVVLNNFKSKIIKVKPSGFTLMELSLSLSLRGFTGGSKVEEGKPEKDDVINIFSVASGHLYERFLRIMMLSVLKHTETPVKFWFLKNYLSPTFKEWIPYMAQEYGFQYELVQYKWPRWLHQQTEKQRIIWGYKILFLDVLFPLAVDKIIFVDADQIVRTDLKELRDFDLEGAPYGYTPFCESRREMDGYRFWKTGYWASHLAGRKYHISALYVVDLKKFRKIAAGDRLRGQYQGLSQDPNSLSNLDQDLPNNMIHQVPIKSLPQDWLWCETWCDDTSKTKAKTIDLVRPLPALCTCVGSVCRCTDARPT
uniref:UDP-glucose ceramide glucosyltransferase-like 1 n=1 Tax=Electrophorus electricus TaxID=8005 RepID=A0AAY5F5Y9_ELEEL